MGLQEVKISIAVNEKITERYWKLQPDHRASENLSIQKNEMQPESWKQIT